MYLDASAVPASSPPPSHALHAMDTDGADRHPDVHFTRLQFGMHCTPARVAPDAFHVVHGATHHAALELPAGWLSVSAPFAGSLRAASRQTEWEVTRRRVLLWSDALTLRCTPRGGWLTVCASPSTWRRAGADARVLAELLPEESRGTRDLFRLMLRVARGARGARGVDPFVAAALLDAAHAQQARLHDWMARCTGRTHQNRRRMMLRLLHLRHVIRCNLDRSLDMAEMSRLSNYSVWHLARAYRAVFDETPVEYAIRQRLAHALALVRHSRLPFCSIADAAGFESQSSFSRAFKSFHGMTPTAARDAALEAMAIAD